MDATAAAAPAAAGGRGAREDPEVRRKRERPPQLTPGLAAELVARLNLTSTLTKDEKVEFVRELESYDDRNAELVVGGDRVVLKLHNGVESSGAGLAFVRAQRRALRWLAKDGKVEAPVDVDGDVDGDDAKAEEVTVVTLGGVQHAVRMLRYVEGELLFDAYRRAATREEDARRLYRRVGEALGSLDACLRTFEDESTLREHVWDVRCFANTKQFLPFVRDPNRRATLEEIHDAFSAAEPEMRRQLRSQVIQGDANDRNLVVTPSGNVAVLDFGDMTRTWVVAELAIALAYAVITVFSVAPVPDVAADDAALDATWLGLCAALVGGYVSRFDLTPFERECLFVLARARLATSASIGAFSAAQQPDNQEYLSIHSLPAYRAMAGMRRVGGARFHDVVSSHGVLE